MSEFPKPKIIIDNKEYDILSFDEFKERKNLYHMTNATIGYNCDKDHLDYTKLGRFRYVIYNKKAIEFELSERRRHHAGGVT